MALLLVYFKARCKNFVDKIHAKLFYNPIIQYIILNAMKLLVISLIALKAHNNTTDLVISSAILLVIAVSALGFFFLLRQNHDLLKERKMVDMIGSLYQDKNVFRSRHMVHFFPLAFFVRRIIFASVTVFLPE